MGYRPRAKRGALKLIGNSENFKNSQKFFNDPDRYRAIAGEAGLPVDPQPLAAMIEMLQRYHPSGYEVTILPQRSETGIYYRGVLDKQWLRLHPEYIRTLYGGLVDADWTMVGQITYMPKNGLEMPLHTNRQEEAELIDPEQNKQRKRLTDR